MGGGETRDMVLHEIVLGYKHKRMRSTSDRLRSPKTEDLPKVEGTQPKTEETRLNKARRIWESSRRLRRVCQEFGP